MKSTKAEIRRRVEEIVRLRLAGAELVPDIVQYAASQNWQVRRRMLWNYVDRADRIIARGVEKDRQKLLARHLRQRRLLFARALEQGDIRAALAVARDEAELEALYPPQKARVEHSGPDGGPIPHAHAVTDADRASAIHALLARLGEAGPGRDPEPDGNGPGPDPR